MPSWAAGYSFPNTKTSVLAKIRFNRERPNTPLENVSRLLMDSLSSSSRGRNGQINKGNNTAHEVLRGKSNRQRPDAAHKKRAIPNHNQGTENSAPILNEGPALELHFPSTQQRLLNSCAPRKIMLSRAVLISGVSSAFRRTSRPTEPKRKYGVYSHSPPETKPPCGVLYNADHYLWDSGMIASLTPISASMSTMELVE